MNLKSNRRTWLALSSTMAAGSFFTSRFAFAQQQTWPSQPIRMIVPFTPGTGADVLARTLGPKLAERLGQAVVVENRAGASGAIGTAAVASSAPDGYTLLMTANTLVMNSHLQANLSYDPLKSFSPVSRLAVTTLALVVTPTFPAKTLRDAIAEMKAHPGKYTYASPGAGTPQHLAMELFKSETGTFVLHVPYKGSAGAVTDVIGGQVDMMMLSLHLAIPYARAGRMRILGVAGATRAPFAPDEPTFLEQGVKDVDVDAWFGLLAPANTPAAIVDRLYSEVTRAMGMPDVLSVLEKQGISPRLGTSQQLGALMQSDFSRWGALVKKMGIKSD